MATKSQILSVKARQIYDSRGNPTVEVDVVTNLGLFRAAVPSGASTGQYEALELRDVADKNNWMGKGVQTAVKNVNEIIAPKILGWDVTQQEKLDDYMVHELDGSKGEWGYSCNKLGANAILGVSLAVARAGAAAKDVPLFQHIADISGTKNICLPVPAFNIINGGSHAGNKLPMQEFMIMPVGCKSFSEALKVGAEVYHHLKKVINKKYGQDATNVGDEGGFAPPFQDSEEALKLISEAIKNAGHVDKVKFAMDVAASEFCKKEEDEKDPSKKPAQPWKYDLNFKVKNNDGSQVITSDKLAAIYAGFIDHYPFASVEDPFDEDDFPAWVAFTAAQQAKVQIVGDDLTVTNTERIKKAVAEKACNTLLLKVNQIGSLTDAIRAVNLAKQSGWGVMGSHRSGETEDTFLADLVVGLGIGQLKTGAPCRSERLAKYNQLLRIEEELADKAVFAGSHFHRPDVLFEKN